MSIEKKKTVSVERLKPAFIAKMDLEIEDNQRPDINNSHSTNMNAGFKTYSNRKRVTFAPNINFKQQIRGGKYYGGDINYKCRRK